MVAKKTKLTIGSNNHKQKNVSNSMINAISKYQRHLQREENIKFGRKARNISFVFATKNPSALARFILGGNKR